MEKTGWRDRSPYRSIPMASSLNSLRVAGVEGARPFDTNLVSPVGKLSNALYAKDAVFNVEKMDWKGDIPLKPPHENPTTMDQKFENAKHKIDWHMDYFERKSSTPPILDAVKTNIDAYEANKTEENLQKVETAANFLQLFKDNPTKAVTLSKNASKNKH